ncbi:MAG: hypothetical protein HY454_01775 [Parcubacteria group bacterium]|nr:hypothetical protein [Parcubacteria group bacterium]
MIRNKRAPIALGVSFVALGVAISIIGVLFLANPVKYDRYDKKDFIDSTTYQAVYLTNDQIYFGHLKNTGPNYLILADVYYVKVNEDGAGQLVKLGQIEPHGPKDEMVISREHILFWENMKPDSPVVKTIQSIQSQRK